MTKKDKYKNKKEKQLHQFYYLWDEIKRVAEIHPPDQIFETRKELL
jgi:hypothetical protein